MSSFRVGVYDRIKSSWLANEFAAKVSPSIKRLEKRGFKFSGEIQPEIINRYVINQLSKQLYPLAKDPNLTDRELTIYRRGIPLLTINIAKTEEKIPEEKKIPQRWVSYFIGKEKTDGDGTMKDLLGGKGANLAEMTRVGLPVPPGFAITTEACREYFQKEQQLPEGLWDEVLAGIRVLEEKTGKKFGDPNNPLLVSVRSGAKFSMPGMMDTVLNLGMNERVKEGLSRLTSDPRFANDAYRRFVQMFGRIVLNVAGENFEKIIEKKKEEKGIKLDTESSAEDLNEITLGFKKLIKETKRVEVPDDPYVQLKMAIGAVFESWQGKRAVDYRNYHKIPHDLGTAVNVQAMVFGNMGSNSATGVAFTRNPSTGEKKLYGEYLPNAQGEDVVAGTRTPKKIEELEEEQPAVYRQFIETANLLERHYRDIQDLEFTVEKGKLWMLQTRTGKRTAQAAVKIAVDMVNEGLITKKEALLRIEPDQIYQLLLPQFDYQEIETARKEGRFLAKGLNASPGSASGITVFDADTAEALGIAGEKVILVRPETNSDDVHGMLKSKGILTQRGGATSHAAVVGRGLGLPCVTGCEAITVDPGNKRFSVGDKVVAERSLISIDGTTGEVFLGKIPTIATKFEELEDLNTLLKWADEVKKLGVWANADYPRDAEKARQFGAEGIGLCRTEHMFFEEERLPIMQEMILAAPNLLRSEAELRRIENELSGKITEEKKENLKSQLKTAQNLYNSYRTKYYGALNRLLPFQKEDFKGIFREMDGLPVIIRLLDPPLHEFLPKHEELLAELMRLKTKEDIVSAFYDFIRETEKSLDLPEGQFINQIKTRLDAELQKLVFTKEDKEKLDKKKYLLDAVEVQREMNPMLGLRGCRLGLIFPGINEMQIRAIFEGACEVAKENKKVYPEVMIPLVGHVNELKKIRDQLEKVAKEVMKEQGIELSYKFGTMIELPRAALTADQIAEFAEFFSFGTNDLTQTVFGISRDDAEGKFLLKYVEEGILPENPFQVLDREGVGKLVKMAVELGKKTRTDIEIGICGEHGGDPSSIEFFHQVGLKYVSCSPFRVPIARISAAQAAIGEKERPSAV